MDEPPAPFPPPPDEQRPAGETGPTSAVERSERPGLFPLDMNRIFELTLSIFRFRWRTFVGAALIVMLPVSVLIAVASVYTIEASADWQRFYTQLMSGAPFDFARSFPWPWLATVLATSIVFGMASTLVHAALTHAGAATFRGQHVSAIEAVRAAVARLRTLIPVFLVTFGASIAIVIGAAALAGFLFALSSDGTRIVPGPQVFVAIVVLVAAFAALVFLSVRWAFAIPAVMLEDAGAVIALQRSWRLASGSGWRVLAYIILFVALLGAFDLLVTMVLALAFNPELLNPSAVTELDPIRLAVMDFFGTVVGAVLMGLPAVAMTLLYFDLRWRRGEPVSSAATQPSVAEEKP